MNIQMLIWLCAFLMPLWIIAMSLSMIHRELKILVLHNMFVDQRNNGNFRNSLKKVLDNEIE